jgi:MFS transporter, FSR family, fosmidomycin resistance protein
VFEELSAGVGTVSAPDLEHTFGISHAFVTSVLFLVPGVIGLVVEPYLFVLADRHPKRWFIRLGTAGMALGALGAALAPGPLALGFSLALLYVSIGVASGLAQAALVDRDPDQRARTIARFTLLSLAGDLGAPALLAGLAVLGASWRAAYVIVAALLAAWSLALAAVPLPDAPTSDVSEPDVGVLATLRDAIADRRLVLWLFAMALCDLLDEIFVVLAAIHIRGDLGGGPLAASAAVTAFVAGGGIGLVLLDRLLSSRDEHTVLVRCAPLCAVAYLGWLAAPNALASILLAIPVGITAAPLYPLASSHAYATRPAKAATVLAASHLFTPLGLAMPFALGVVADHFGTYAALATLAIQPFGLWILAWRGHRRLV